MKSADLEAGLSYESHLKKVLTNSTSYPFTGVGASELDQQIKFVAGAMKANESCVSKKTQESMRPLCNTQLGQSAKDVVALATLGLTLQEIIKILTGSWDRDTFFKESLACQDDGILIPKSISCQDVDTIKLASKAKSQLHYQQQAAARIDVKLAKGIPVGISACTRFFTNPSSKLVSAGSTQFRCGDRKDAAYKSGEGSHAVTAARMVSKSTWYKIAGVMDVFIQPVLNAPKKVASGRRLV